ncbi:fatty acyl-CoA reductase wat-like [Aphis craccivora]|uniref:Fatty acyl-CoA reductase wat-like n=1 Tax=Aphis craccivora TaxID=307492 RepID=A0A6G0ZNZ9_APHCR|nr:fatty acyl-CoA reductase wat-like [Aphis craccivora]
MNKKSLPYEFLQSHEHILSTNIIITLYSVTVYNLNTYRIIDLDQQTKGNEDKSCQVDSIAILVRSKKGLSASQRIKEIYNIFTIHVTGTCIAIQLYTRYYFYLTDFEVKNQIFIESIKVIDGHLEESSLDREWLIEKREICLSLHGYDYIQRTS